MIQLTDEAQASLERYLRNVRSLLSGAKTVDSSEVENDIRLHVEEALHGNPEPVGVVAVDQVIESLGTPEQWIPDIEIPPWKKALMQLREGPEDYRLGYYSLVLLLFGLILAEISVYISLSC